MFTIKCMALEDLIMQECDHLFFAIPDSSRNLEPILLLV